MLEVCLTFCERDFASAKQTTNPFLFVGWLAGRQFVLIYQSEKLQHLSVFVLIVYQLFDRSVFVAAVGIRDTHKHTQTDR